MSDPKKKKDADPTSPSDPGPFYCPWARRPGTCDSCGKKEEKKESSGNGIMSRILIPVILVTAILAGMKWTQNRTGPDITTSGHANSGQANSGRDPAENRIRIATWDLFPLDYRKVSDPVLLSQIGDVLQLYDLIAVGGLLARNETVVEAIQNEMASRGLTYEALTLPPEDHPYGQSVFFYNKDRIESDVQSLYDLVIANSDDPPLLAGAFRAIGPDDEAAFTFVLVHLGHTPIGRLPAGGALRDVWNQAAARSGREGITEDDLILLGCFGVAPCEMGDLTSIPGLVAIHSDRATAATGLPCNNIIFNERATTEYTERFGILSTIDYFHLARKDADRLSPCYPLWAEFTSRETRYGL